MSTVDGTGPGRRAFPEISGLPATRWQIPVGPGTGDEDRDGRGIVLTDARAGVHLGTDRGGTPVGLPCTGPRGVRIGVLGDALFGRLLACRLVAVGVRVTALTRKPALWDTLRTAAGDRLVLADAPDRWPGGTPAPPGVDDGPQALVCDLWRPPRVPSADAAEWTTVVHVTRQPPGRSSFWQRPDAVIVLDSGHAPAVRSVLGERAARLTASLEQGEIALFQARDGGDGAVFRPVIASTETALLMPRTAGPGASSPPAGAS